MAEILEFMDQSTCSFSNVLCNIHCINYELNDNIDHNNNNNNNNNNNDTSNHNDDDNSNNVCFQKISRPPPWRELEILEGLGAQRPRKFRWDEGFED